MAENPLLPNAELAALLALTKRCAAMEKAAAGKLLQANRRLSRNAQAGSREALLAAATMQLRPGDILLAEAGDSTAASLTPPAKEGVTLISPLLPELGKDGSRMMLAAAMAAALRVTATDGVATVLLRAGTAETGWPAALAWAQEQLLPIVFVCTDPTGPAAFRSGARAARDAFTWEAVKRSAARLQLPILTVDGEDGVAMYRVMQESVLRARAGGGPAMIWAMLPSSKQISSSRPRSATPVARLEQYLRARKIPF